MSEDRSRCAASPEFTLSNDDGDLYDPRTGVNYRADLYWRTEREDRAGPVRAHCWNRRWPHWAAAVHPVQQADVNVPVEHPPRQPGELAHTGTPAHRWNVLIIEVEWMRARELHAGGSPVVVMPTVEAIAKDSRRYINAYTAATQTNLAAVVPCPDSTRCATTGRGISGAQRIPEGIAL